MSMLNTRFNRRAQLMRSGTLCAACSPVCAVVSLGHYHRSQLRIGREHAVKTGVIREAGVKVEYRWERGRLARRKYP